MKLYRLEKGGTWRWASTPPNGWHKQRVCLDVETKGDGSPRVIGLGVPGQTVLCAPSATLERWINDHVSGWLAYFMNADKHFADAAGLKLSDVDDAALMYHLVDENVMHVSASLDHVATNVCDFPNWKLATQRDIKNPERRDKIPDDLLAERCAYDVQATLAVHGVAQAVLDKVPQFARIYKYISRPLMEALYKTEREGIPVSEEAIDVYIAGKTAEKSDLYKAMVTLDERIKPVNLRAPGQVATFLYETLNLPEQISWKTQERTTDMNALYSLLGQHPIIDEMIEFRKCDQRIKMAEGWRKRMVGGRLHSRYNGAGTVTGRLSGEDPNPQNFPTDKNVRNLVVAPPGYVIVAADYKTLEIGGAAWQYGEPGLMEAYLTGDPHTFTATDLLSRTPANSSERKKYGKSPNFRLLYQQGERSFFEAGRKDGITWSQQEASSIRMRWHERYPGVRAAWKRIGNLVTRDGYLETFSGRLRRLPEIHPSYQKAVRNHAWRQATNAIVQTPCGECCHIAIILADGAFAGIDVRIILDVHDSVVLLSPEKRATQTAHELRSIMEEDVPRYWKATLGRELGIPLRVDVGIGPSWGSLKEVPRA